MTKFCVVWRGEREPQRFNFLNPIRCPKNYNARAQLLFSLNFLFSDFPVAVAVVFPDNLSAELSAST